MMYNLNVQQLMHLGDFYLNGGLSFGISSLQGQMINILRLLQLT